MSVFRHVFLRLWGVCYFFPRCCGLDSPPMSPSLLYHKPLRNCNIFFQFFDKSKKKTKWFCILTTSFNTARFEHENEMRGKALKRKKIGIQPFLESGIHSMGSRIQDCHGFPYMGRKIRNEIDNF